MTELAMRNAIRNHLNRKTLRVTDRFLLGLAVGHDTWKLENLGDPAAIVLAIEVDRRFTLEPVIY